MTLTLVVAGAIALAVPQTISARQQTSGGQRGAASTTAASRMARGNPQGFSVVLVVGDLQGAPGDGDVPPAARQALADMKDFLPYKSYKLLDAAWIMSSYTHSTTRLRGPEEREYEIEITATPASKDSAEGAQRINVQFSLRDTIFDEPSLAESRGSTQVLRDKLTESERALKQARERQPVDRAEVQRLEQTVAEVREKLAQATRSSGGRRLEQGRLANSPLMNTTFTMDVGETVVVGTSRLRSNSKALIALLTAVPQRASRSRE
jgi:hypothetical protein